VSAPRDLWHPCLIVVDEAHIFAPQTGQAESASAVIDLMTRGRKRGFCGIIATQRISKLHKDAAAEANNKLIGRSSLDVDMKRAADELGFSSREDMLTLRNLQDGEFYAFGPAISNVVTRCKVGPVETTHPKAGQRAAPPPPPKDKVQKVLSQLADLPKEAEAEQASRVELQRRVRELETELRKGKGAAPAVPADPERLKREFERGANSVKRALATELRLCAKTAASIQPATLSALRNVAESVTRAMAHVEQVQIPTMPSLETIIEQVKKAEPARASLAMAATAPSPARTVTDSPEFRRERLERAKAESNGSLPSGERRVLTAVAQYPDGVTLEQLTVLTGYRATSRYEYIRRLTERGHVEKAGERIKATDSGWAALGPDFEPLPTGDKLREYWMAKLPDGERKVLQVLVEAAPQSVRLQAIGEIVNYKATSMYEYVRRLAAKRLVISSGGEARASGELFG